VLVTLSEVVKYGKAGFVTNPAELHLFPDDQVRAKNQNHAD
jgi:hypothetical protein